MTGGRRGRNDRVERQEEMDECWKKLAEKIEEEVLDNYKVEDKKEVLTEEEAPFWNEGVYEEAGST